MTSAGTANQHSRHSEQMWQRLFRRFQPRASTLQGQLRDMIVAAILDGFLAPGAAVPSTRALAKTLKVSRLTATLALQTLTDKGLLVSRARSGFYVSTELQSTFFGSREALADQLPRPRWTRRFAFLPSKQRNIVKPADWQRHAFPFIFGQFDVTLFPLREWRQCVQETLQSAALGSWAQDRVNRDDDLLVDQIHQRLLPARGIWVRRDEILITAGAQQGMYMLATLLLDARSVVGIENPGYPDARNNFLLRTRNVLLLPVNDSGLALGEKLGRCDYVYVTPSHQCPTTVTMPLEQRQALLARAARDDFILIEDDDESELNFSGRPTPALKSLDRAARVIYLGSLSKTLAHGLRLGYVVAPAELIHELRALRRLIMRHSAANNEAAAALFIAHGFHELYLRRLNLAYRERASALRTALRTHAPTLRSVDALGGSALWVQAPAGTDTRDLAARALVQGIVIEPGEVFFAGRRRPSNTMRLGYSSIALDRIDEGVRRLGALL